MERSSPSRSEQVVLGLEWTVAPAEETGGEAVSSQEAHNRKAQAAVHANGDPVSAAQLPPCPAELNHSQALKQGFDQQLRRLQRLRARLRPSLAETETPNPIVGAVPDGSPKRPKPACPPSYVLRETLVYLNRLEHPPLLPAPRTASFEDAFKRHEAMFHTVFYRKYAPVVRDDAKQEALLALFRKWLKDKSLLEQSSAYVVQAAIYGVSNWRQKGMKVRGREAQLMVDNQGKVAGEPQRNFNERWTDRIDLRLDVASAVWAVLDQHEACPEYREIYHALDDVRHEVPFKQGLQESGLSFRTYKKLREQIKADLRLQLAEYAAERSDDLQA